MKSDPQKSELIGTAPASPFIEPEKVNKILKFEHDDDTVNELALQGYKIEDINSANRQYMPTEAHKEEGLSIDEAINPEDLIVSPRLQEGKLMVGASIMSKIKNKMRDMVKKEMHKKPMPTRGSQGQGGNH